jgi:hypothetical protein
MKVSKMKREKMSSPKNLVATTIILGAVAVAGAVFSGLFEGVGSGGGDSDPRRFAVKYSVNGAPFRYPNGDADKPERPYKTREEAIKTAKDFVATSAALKGAAKVIDVRSGKEVSF